MPYVMKAYGTDSMGNTADGVYVMSYDLEAFGGRGEVSFTTDKQSAMQFKDATEAFNVWRSQSKTRPTRPDGRPNRPLTALTIEFEPT